MPSACNLARADVLGVGVHAINMQDAVAAIDAAVRQRRKGYVCATGVHGVMEARSDAGFRHILNCAMVVTPDGMPLVWVGHWQGFRAMDRVYGPELMLELCRLSVQRGYTHFFYGGKPGIADRVARNLQARFPGLRVVGSCTAPFRPLDAAEERDLKTKVAEARPDFFWVGMSTPKQERFMARYLDRLDCTVMLGVGAAFDVHTGSIKDAPQFVKRAGLQWLHRLVQEPRRLWKRYLLNNPRFLYLIALQLLTERLSARSSLSSE